MKMYVPEENFKTKSTFQLFAAYYRPNLKLFTLDMFCASIIALIDLSFPFVSRHALQTYLPQENYQTFFIIIIALFFAFLFRAGMQYIVNYWGHLMGADMEMQMRRDLFYHLQKMSFSFYDNSRTGNLMSRILSDLFDIVELAHHGPEDILISTITLIGSFVAMSFINRNLALILLLFLPVLLLFTVFLRKRMARASRTMKSSTAEINADIESSISGVRVSKAFANEEHELKRFFRGSQLYRNARGGFYRIMALFTTGMDFMTGMLNLLAIGFGGYFIMKGYMTLVDLVAFTLYIAVFLAPIRKLTNFAELYQSGMAGFTRFVELMREDPEIADAPSALSLENIKGEIVFNHVSFSYSEEETAAEVLRDINLTIPAGKTVAVVGPSGGGKTTLCHLIPRFYEINSGSITIDGIDVRQTELSSLRQNIGIVQQDVFLFATSIMENIRYGKLDASDEEVIEAAKKAELHDFIVSLPEGYQTYVGERGLKLSGGQKQRMAIARVFLKNPPILILDEATSALDTVTEKKIQSALERLSEGRTCLVIAHRLSTVRRAGEIIYIDENGVKERGTHQELLSRNGAYAKLHDLSE